MTATPCQGHRREHRLRHQGERHPKKRLVELLPVEVEYPQQGRPGRVGDELLQVALGVAEGGALCTHRCFCCKSKAGWTCHGVVSNSNSVREAMQQAPALNM